MSGILRNDYFSLSVYAGHYNIKQENQKRPRNAQLSLGAPGSLARREERFADKIWFPFEWHVQLQSFNDKIFLSSVVHSHSLPSVMALYLDCVKKSSKVYFSSHSDDPLGRYFLARGRQSCDEACEAGGPYPGGMPLSCDQEKVEGCECRFCHNSLFAYFSLNMEYHQFWHISLFWLLTAYTKTCICHLNNVSETHHPATLLRWPQLQKVWTHVKVSSSHWVKHQRAVVGYSQMTIVAAAIIRDKMVGSNYWWRTTSPRSVAKSMWTIHASECVLAITVSGD